jgi:Ca2+-binding EF-hand superfamily protein
MSGLSGIGPGGYNPYALQQYQQNLFNQIDTNGDGSITQAELEQAVTADGGTKQAADALFSQLDPNNTGSVSEQQFAQAFPGPSFSDQTQAQLIGYQAQGWPGPATAGPGGGLAQSLFSQIDTNGDGTITQSELEQAVTAAGGTTQAADALYAQLDPNNTGSVSEQQFAQGLSQILPHHHGHHHGGGADAANSTNSNTADGALASLFDADSGNSAPGSSPTQIAQNIFSQIDTNGTGSITQTELEQAVTAAGGTTQGADALYAQLDPNNTGSVTEQQFVQALQPPSASGTTAQDAVLALLDSVTQSTANPSSASASTTAVSSTTPSSSGNTAQDAIAALLQNFNGSESNAFGSGNSPQDAFLALLSNSGISGLNASGNTAQDAVLALLQANSTSSSSSGSTSGSGAANSPDIAAAISLYQAQFNQQLFGGLFGAGGAGV